MFNHSLGRWANLSHIPPLEGNEHALLKHRHPRVRRLVRNGSSNVHTNSRGSSVTSSLAGGAGGNAEQDQTGTTFVELIKRSGSHLGVVVTGGSDTGLRPRVADLVAGSWAQRSNVLCVGDLLVGLNGAECGRGALTQVTDTCSCHRALLHCSVILQHEIVTALDTADRVQLEVGSSAVLYVVYCGVVQVRYRLPPARPPPRTRARALQVSISSVHTTNSPACNTICGK